MRPSGYLVPGALLWALLGGGFVAVPPAAAQFTPALQDVITSPCKLDVVLVTFQDATEATRKQSGWPFDCHNCDLPHGYSANSDGALVPGTSSYTMDDFKRLFSGGYPYSVNGEPEEDVPEFTRTQTVAENMDGVSETLPEVFGSLRHYFHVISGGDFELRVRILNEERNGYRVWVELPETKGFFPDGAQQICPTPHHCLRWRISAVCSAAAARMLSASIRSRRIDPCASARTA